MSACTDVNGRPDFVGFAAALREEAAWVKRLNASGDKAAQAQAAGDVLSLLTLAERVERVGERLGFLTMDPPAAPSPKVGT